MTQHTAPHYWIAQHIEDLFRKEASNIGVILAVNNKILTRFLGEKPDGRIDGRVIRVLPHPNVFIQWVDFWRETCAEARQINPKELSGHHYRVIEGGSLTGGEARDHAHMLDYLFNAIVSPEGAAAALMMDQEFEDSIVRQHLDHEIQGAFRSMGLLDGDAPLFVEHPILQGARFKGHSLSHRPSFSQRNGKLYVMEHVDFTHRQRQRMSDLAGRTAYMFSDLRHHQRDLEAITVVRLDDEDREDEIISYGLGMLESESDRLINWLDKRQREEFLKERAAVARGGSV